MSTYGIALASVVLASCALAQQTSWLDQPLTNWNREGQDFPLFPRPEAQARNGDQSVCRQSLRRPVVAAERAVVRQGWLLFGPAQVFGNARVFTATAGFDGMCRPMHFQAFVYSEGRYAGTLSPVAMSSRTDGVLTTIRLVSPAGISADFARYGPDDPLCCPSRTSTVHYGLRNDDIPDLLATQVTHTASCPPGEETAPTSQNHDMAELSGKRWFLVEIGQQRLAQDRIWIEFNTSEGRVSGDGGCNRFSGQFTASGASLRIGRLIATRRACVEAEANRLETMLLQTLEEVTRFGLQQGDLTLYANDRPVLVFSTR